MGPDPGASWARTAGRVAAGVFAVLLVFGLVLLFTPDLANELEERSAGGAASDPQNVSITEAKRTTEETTETDRGSTSDRSSRSSANRPRGGRGRGGPSNSKTTQSSQANETITTTTTETTTTETSATPEKEGVFEEVFAVPSVTVLLRLASIGLLAALASLPLLWATRRSSSGAVPAPDGKASPAAPVEPTKTRPPVPAVAKPANAAGTATGPNSAAGPNGRGSNGHPNPASGPVQLPVKLVVTRADADRAKTRIMQGIPLLREVFEARGEPKISNTLPDMRVRVKLTETLTKEQPLPVSVLAEDPTLGLSTFRTEVEQRLRRLARDAVAQSADSTDSILRSLTDEGLFEPQAAEGFSNLLKMTERAVHGARVDPSMGAWVREEGVSLLLSLDLMLPS